MAAVLDVAAVVVAVAILQVSGSVFVRLLRQYRSH